ncbi:unnamed protein product [Rhizoctonia solani]|uniref:Uncharacterized protein n=1 Tax=Rhizoctonia solani TaxID=456999 RepID=A0A8H3E125_9AGAM|nr:unnamed protein product [Rhizoctonia solani]
MYQWDKDIWTTWDDARYISVTKEDSREIVRTFTDHLAQISTESDMSMSLLHLSNTLFFLGGRILPDSEDLLGAFFEAFIGRLWFAVIHQEGDDPFLAEAFGTMFSWLKTILERLRRTWDVDPMSPMRIIVAIVR